MANPDTYQLDRHRKPPQNMHIHIKTSLSDHPVSGTCAKSLSKGSWASQTATRTRDNSKIFMSPARLGSSSEEALSRLPVAKILNSHCFI